MSRTAWFAAGFVLGAVLLHCASAPAKSRPIDRKLQQCMVQLVDMKDAKLRRWCLQQSKRMP